MKRSFHLAELLAEQLREFIIYQFDIPIDEATEDPHVFAFLEHCVERPAIHGPLLPGYLQKPIRSTLTDRIEDLQLVAPRLNLPLIFTHKSIDYARKLACQYAQRHKGSRALTPEEIALLLNDLNLTNPYDKRFKAIFLCAVDLWSRPNDVLKRLWPDEISADHDEGVALVVPRSKTNPGPWPERLGLKHRGEGDFCAPCALFEWIEWLQAWQGGAYRGPVFPILKSLSPHQPLRPLKTCYFWRDLKNRARRCGIKVARVGAYSPRKSGATIAALRGDSIDVIRDGLRQKNIQYTAEYIDTDLVFDLVGSILA